MIDMFQKLRRDEEGLVRMTALLILCGLALFAFLIWVVMDMLVKNILPICIGIAIIIAVPIAAKGWYFKKTGKEYESPGGLIG